MAVPLIFGLLTFCLSIFTPSTHWAEETPASKKPFLEDSLDIQDDIRFLQEETVSIAVQHEQPISEAPSNVYVITEEDIRQSGAIDLPTLLRRVPGMEVIQMTGADFNVSVRGDNQLRANKLLVMVDGRSIYLDMQGEVFWKAIPVTLPEIKRIEVLKGPASALYGFNAFDGIINIITKSPDEMKGTTIQVAGGEFGTFLGSVIQAGKQKKLGYRLSFSHEQTDQWENRDSLAYRAYKFNSSFDYALPKESKVTLSGGYLNSNKYDGPIVDTLELASEPSIGYVYGGFERQDFFVRAWWTRYTQPSINNVNPLIAANFTVLDKTGTTINETLKANSTNIDVQHTLKFGTTNRLTYGANYRHNQVSSNFLDGDGREDRLGLYVQDEWKATKTLTAVVGLRFDMDSFINPTYSPRFFLVFKPVRDHTFRSSVSVAHRSPTIFETRTLSLGRAFIPQALPPNTRLLGSHDLGTEKITSYELGYQGWFFRHRIRARVDLFFNHITDLIGTGPVTPFNPTINTFHNGSGPTGGGVADIYGFETGVEFLVNPWLTGFSNYAYQEIGQSYSDLSTVRRGAPRFKVNGGLRADLNNSLNGEAVLHYVGSARYNISPAFAVLLFPPDTPPDTRVGSYFLLNLRGAYRFWKVDGKDRAEFALSVFNALNDKHKEHPLGELLRVE